MGIIEALSFGIPCLITKGTTLGHYVSRYNAGWVAETNAESIAKAIKTAINDFENYEEYGKNARRLAKNNFAWPLAAKTAVEKYKKLVGA